MFIVMGLSGIFSFNTYEKFYLIIGSILLIENILATFMVWEIKE